MLNNVNKNMLVINEQTGNLSKEIETHKKNQNLPLEPKI